MRCRSRSLRCGRLLRRARAVRRRARGVRHPGQRLAQRRQRGVVRDQVHAPAPLIAGRFRQDVGGVDGEVRLHPRILQADLHVVGADAAGERPQVAMSRQLLEVDVPQPRHVMAVRLLVVDEEGDGLGALVLEDDLDVLVEPGGVFRQVQQDGAALHAKPLQAAVLGIELVDRLLDGGRLDAAEARADGDREQVVHHVRTAEGGADLERLARAGVGGRHRERQPLRVQLHLRGRPKTRRAREPARRAAVLAQLAVLAVFVLHHRGAALAHLGVDDRVLG